MTSRKVTLPIVAAVLGFSLMACGDPSGSVNDDSGYDGSSTSQEDEEFDVDIDSGRKHKSGSYGSGSKSGSGSSGRSGSSGGGKVGGGGKR